MFESVESENQILVPISDNIAKLCLTLVKQIVDNQPGITDEELHWIEQTRQDCKNFLIYKNGGQLSKAKMAELESKKLLNENKDEMFVTYELLNALHATCKYIQVVNPKLIRDQQLQPEVEFPDIAARANIEFLNFFIKIQKHFNYSERDLNEIYQNVFKLSGLDNELRIKALETFPGGVLAAVRTYLVLTKELPGWSITVPSIDLDLHHGVDLIAKSPEGKERYFEIKGGRNTAKIDFCDITTPQQMEEKRKQITLGDNQNQNQKLESLYKIHEFVQQKIKTGVDAKGYFVEAPSA